MNIPGNRVIVKTIVPFWVLSIMRHLVLGDPRGDHNFDNDPIFKALVVVPLVLSRGDSFLLVLGLP